MARNKGVVACVTDGMVRDIDGIDAVGIPVFARGVSPNSPFKDGPGEIGLAVVIGGVADRSPATSWSATRTASPSCRASARAEVVAALAAVAAKEAEMDEAIRAGANEATWVQATIAAKGVRFVD